MNHEKYPAMKRLSLVPLTVLVALVTAAALRPSAAPTPAAPVGPGAVLAMHQRLFRAIDAGETEAALAYLHEDMRMDDDFRPRPCTLHFVDADGSSSSASNHAESRALLADRVGASSGERWSTRIVSGFDDCYSGELSYGVLEFERTRETAGERVSERYRSTSVVTWDGGWKLTHWHVSPVRARAASADER